MSRRERVDALLEAFGKEIEALGDEALDEIAQAEREANAKEKRYYEAVEERVSVDAEIAAMTAEREELPDRAYRAGMDENYQLEDELKERFKNLRLALEALEERCGSLKEEISRLLPRGRGHDLDARILASASVTGAAYRARADLEHLKEGLTKALNAAVDPILQAHTDRLAEAEDLTRQRDWDLSPAGMGHRYVPLKQ